MARLLPVLLLSFLLSPSSFAAQQTIPEDVFTVGPDVKPPKVTHKVAPVYSREARSAFIQGTVVLQIIINEEGRATDIAVLSPVGFGLDERAQAAVAQWKFKPARKAGKPVKFFALIDVNFRLPQLWFDNKAEKRRTAFNLAIVSLSRTNDHSRIEQSVKTIQDLANQKYPNAMYLLGRMHRSGQFVEKNPDYGLTLITEAAEKNYGPALYTLGLMNIEGKGMPADFEKGMQMMRDAAVLGSFHAQFFLASHYERGDSVPKELDRAQRYYRLCATSGTPMCQFRLGKLLLERPGRQEFEYTQSLAWLELAADHGIVEAKNIVQTETPKLTEQQTAWVKKLKSQMVHGPR